MRKTAVKIFLASLWCVCFYRAVTQSIVHDEAYTFRALFDARHAMDLQGLRCQQPFPQYTTDEGLCLAFRGKGIVP